MRGENLNSRGKAFQNQNRVNNQQTQPTYDSLSGNRTHATLMEVECSHRYANIALPLQTELFFRPTERRQ